MLSSSTPSHSTTSWAKLSLVALGRNLIVPISSSTLPSGLHGDLGALAQGLPLVISV